MVKLCLYFRRPDPDRWLPGDRYPRALVRRVVRGKPRAGGVGRVFLNLCEGLRRNGTDFVINLPFSQLRADDRVGVLGVGRDVLKGYDRPNPIVAGIALMTTPGEWPTLFEDYPVRVYLQHSQWAADLYRPYFGDRCGVWPVGIDTTFWRPDGSPKTTDFIVYVKTGEVPPAEAQVLVDGVISRLTAEGRTFSVVRYGDYKEADYRAALMTARGMVFISPRESQGLACEEALACDVPVLAWDPGLLIQRPAGYPPTVSTSVPYFDARCGLKFRTLDEFEDLLPHFLNGVRAEAFAPRAYILDHLTLEKTAAHFCSFLEAVNG